MNAEDIDRLEADTELDGQQQPELEISECMVGGHPDGCTCHEGEPVKPNRVLIRSVKAKPIEPQ